MSKRRLVTNPYYSTVPAATGREMQGQLWAQMQRAAAQQKQEERQSKSSLHLHKNSSLHLTSNSAPELLKSRTACKACRLLCEGPCRLSFSGSWGSASSAAVTTTGGKAQWQAAARGECGQLAGCRERAAAAAADAAYGRAAAQSGGVGLGLCYHRHRYGAFV